MKRGIVLFLSAIAFFLLLNGTYAANGCNNREYFVMLKLSGVSNAHAGLWNSSLGEEICFSNFFNVSGVNSQQDYTTRIGASGTNFRDTNSDGMNIILRLHSETNSHGAVRNVDNNVIANYPIAASYGYGDLKCEVREGTSCEGYKPFNGLPDHYGKEIVFLKNYFNSHVSENPSYGYNIRICCASRNFLPLPSQQCDHDNQIDSGEVCDGNNLNGASCPAGKVGTPRCASDCRSLDYSSCLDSINLPQTCQDNAFQNPDSGQTFSIKIGGVLTHPTSCEEFNSISFPLDRPASYSGSEGDYKREMCNSCSVLISGSDLQDFLPLDGYAPQCQWDESSSTCELGYRSNSNQTCVIRVVEDSECLPGQSVKTVKITNSCDPLCSPQSNGGEGCSQTVTCPQTIALPFFGFASFVSALILIGAIYFLYNKKVK